METNNNGNNKDNENPENNDAASPEAGAENAPNQKLAASVGFEQGYLVVKIDATKHHPWTIIGFLHDAMGWYKSQVAQAEKQKQQIIKPKSNWPFNFGNKWRR